MWYTTRESVKDALDIRETARSDAQVDRAIEAASRAVEGLLHRRFYPVAATRYFDWPRRSRPWRLWLDSNEAVSISSLTSGGEAIPAENYFLRRADDLGEPPYSYIELDVDSGASFGNGPSWQRSIAVTGVFGYGADTESAGSLNGALDASQTSVDVTDASLIGVGDLVLVDDEYMSVTGKAMLDTQTTASALTDRNNDVSITVSTATGAPEVGEVVLIDSERMLVVDRAGTTLTVRRAWDGSVLASHATGTAIHALRTLTVSRAVLGTTAASHEDGTEVGRHAVPGLVSELCLAYALNNLLQARSGYARVAGVDRQGSTSDPSRENTGRGIAGIERDAYRAYGRKVRGI